jgi:signal transduction histidine kinase
MGVLGPLLGDVFAHLATVTWAERRNQGLDMGIALTAHEVRGPLLGAKAVIDHILTTTNGNAEHRRLLVSSRLELGRLAELVDSLLRWSVGPGTVRRRRTDVLEVTREAARSSCMEMGEDRVEFSEMEPSVVRGDPGHLRVAIRNLVRNALAYSSPDTEVKVGVTAKAECVTVSVANRGRGIPPGEEDAIFDPFVRGEAALQTGARGSGLGLFITRKIAEAHGGEVWVDSSPRGTTFYLQLPVANGKCTEPSPVS